MMCSDLGSEICDGISGSEQPQAEASGLDTGGWVTALRDNQLNRRQNPSTCSWLMQRSIRLSLSLGGAAALALANTSFLPAAAQDTDTAEDLGGVMSISLNDVVKPTIGFQGALQGAGTPNQAGIGGFLPLSVGENSV